DQPVQCSTHLAARVARHLGVQHEAMGSDAPQMILVITGPAGCTGAPDEYRVHDPIRTEIARPHYPAGAGRAGTGVDGGCVRSVHIHTGHRRQRVAYRRIRVRNGGRIDGKHLQGQQQQSRKQDLAADMYQRHGDSPSCSVRWDSTRRARKRTARCRNYRRLTNKQKAKLHHKGHRSRLLVGTTPTGEAGRYYPARLISQLPISSSMRIGSSTAISGENPNTRLDGPSRSCTMRKLKPTSTPVNTRWPSVTERSGPKMNEMATNTSAAVVTGCSSFFQNASI